MFTSKTLNSEISPQQINGNRSVLLMNRALKSEAPLLVCGNNVVWWALINATTVFLQLRPNVLFTAKTASRASRLKAGVPRGIPYTVLYKSIQVDTTLYSSEGDTLYNAIQLYTIPYTCIQLYTAPKGIPYAALYNSIQLDRTVYNSIQRLGGYHIQRYTNLYSFTQVYTVLYSP